MSRGSNAPGSVTSNNGQGPGFRSQKKEIAREPLRKHHEVRLEVAVAASGGRGGPFSAANARPHFSGGASKGRSCLPIRLETTRVSIVVEKTDFREPLDAWEHYTCEARLTAKK